MMCIDWCLVCRDHVLQFLLMRYVGGTFLSLAVSICGASFEPKKAAGTVAQPAVGNVVPSGCLWGAHCLLLFFVFSLSFFFSAKMPC